jgi:uncharacterized protein (TIRG00374 family)
VTSTSSAQPEPIIAPSPPQKPAKRYVRIAIQTIVSVGLLVLLGVLAVKYDVWDSIRVIDRGDVAIAGAVLLVACVVNSVRWKLLLNNAGIDRPLRELTGLYVIGIFFSMFLPTGTGGDVVRVYELARKSGKLAAAVVATLQERLLGLGMSMLIGLGASIYYFDRLPPSLRVWVLLAQIAGPVGVALLLYPMVFMKPFAVLWRRAPRGIAEHKIVGRIATMVTSLTAVPPLPPVRLLLVLLVSAIGVTLSISVYWLLGRSLSVGVGLGGFLLIVPLVWVIRLAPVSLGGLGVGEGAITILLGELFGVPQGAAMALALAFLAMQICLALLGGIVLALRVMTHKSPLPPATAAAVEAST